MIVLISRDIFTTQFTSGILQVFDGNNLELFKCFSGEDCSRGACVKIPAETCIPDGKYFLRLTHSVRFKRLMPLIFNQDSDLSVKDICGNKWRGIRIHSGNTESDTDGCVLVGLSRSNNQVIDSKKAFELLFDILFREIGETGKIPMEIVHAPQKIYT